MKQNATTAEDCRRAIERLAATPVGRRPGSGMNEPGDADRPVCLWAIDVVGWPTGEDGDACRPVRLDEVAALAVAAGVAESVVAARLSGSSCYVARADRLIVAYGWVSRGETAIGEIGGVLRPGPAEAYIWDCATLPAYRRRGWYGRLLGAILADLATAGVQRTWIAAREGNVPACRALARKGFEPAIRVDRI